MTQELPRGVPRTLALVLAGLWGVAGCATPGRTLEPRPAPAPRAAQSALAQQQPARGDGWMRLQLPGEELVQVEGRRGLEVAPLPDDVRAALMRDPFLRDGPGTPLYLGARALTAALEGARERCAQERNATCAEPMRERLVRADAACEDVEVEQQLWRARGGAGPGAAVGGGHGARGAVR